MEDHRAEIDKMLTERLGAFKGNVLEMLSRGVQRSGLVASGDLLSSMQAALAVSFGSYIDHTLSFKFNDSGRFAEMKYLNRGSLPPVAALEKWINSRGIFAFPDIPGYSRRPPMSSRIERQRAIRRLAWAIAFNKRQNSQKRPTKWWTKEFYKNLNRLINDVVEDAGRITGQVVIAPFIISKSGSEVL